MFINIEDRVLVLAEHILKTGDTVRGTAQKYGVSKSTVHLDVSKRLKKIDKRMFEKIKKILDKNFNEKHIRGGISTKRKYFFKSLSSHNRTSARWHFCQSIYFCIFF